MEEGYPQTSWPASTAMLSPSISARWRRSPPLPAVLPPCCEAGSTCGGASGSSGSRGSSAASNDWRTSVAAIAAGVAGGEGPAQGFVGAAAATAVVIAAAGATAQRRRRRTRARAVALKALLDSVWAQPRKPPTAEEEEAARRQVEAAIRETKKKQEREAQIAAQREKQAQNPQLDLDALLKGKLRAEGLPVEDDDVDDEASGGAQEGVDASSLGEKAPAANVGEVDINGAPMPPLPAQPAWESGETPLVPEEPRPKKVSDKRRDEDYSRKGVFGTGAGITAQEHQRALKNALAKMDDRDVTIEDEDDGESKSERKVWSPKDRIDPLDPKMGGHKAHRDIKRVTNRGYRSWMDERHKADPDYEKQKAHQEERKQHLLSMVPSPDMLAAASEDDDSDDGGNPENLNALEARALARYDQALKRYGAIQKVLPEDRIRAVEDAKTEMLRNRPHEGGDQPTASGRLLTGDEPTPWIGDEFSPLKRWESLRENAKNDEWRIDQELEDWTGSFALATVEEREEIAKVSREEAQQTIRARRKKAQVRERIGDPIGTGAASPNAYVEIRARPGPDEDGPEKEAVNYVVAKGLGISEEKASKLVRIGAVWVWEPFWAKGWERIKKNEYITPDQVLRVFPNPERFKTCYVEDWRDRVKKVDQDFVVVDKPPLLPCFAKVSNGREALGQCLKEGLHLRAWGGYNATINDNFKPLHTIDDEATGLIVLARHDKSEEVFDEWLEERKNVFEFVALCTSMPEKGIYRHFYKRDEMKAGQAKPALYEEIPSEMIKTRQDYQNWDCAEMEVVATAELPGDCSAVRIKCLGTGYKERIRAQLALLGCPVLNDQGVVKPPASSGQAADRGAARMPMNAETGQDVDSDDEDDDSSPSSITVPQSGFGAEAPHGLQVAAAGPLAGAVDKETFEGPYGQKLELLPQAKKAAAAGVPQTPLKKVPVALHLARVEFGGRVVTCAPPAYWPEGAAAAVAVKLTTQDIREQVHAYLTTHSGYARFGELGGLFGVTKDWLQENFPFNLSAGVVFSSQEAMSEWESNIRIERADKAWDVGPRIKRKEYKSKMFKIREKYIAPQDMGFKKPPRFKQIKKNKVKPVDQSL